MIDALIGMLRRDGEPMTETLRRACVMTLETQNRRIAELEAALLVRLDRKVINDTWRNRAEKADADLIAANDRIAELEAEVAQWEIDHAPIGLSEAIEKRATEVEAELRSDLAAARAALRDCASVMERSFVGCVTRMTHAPAIAAARAASTTVQEDIQ